MKKLTPLTIKFIHTTADCLLEIAHDVRYYDDDCSAECFLLAMHLLDLLDNLKGEFEEEVLPVKKHTSVVKVHKISKGGD